MDTVRPAAGSACAQCPWRLANQGKRNPGGFYTRKNLRRLWAGLRRGERMTCHPTDTRMNDFDHMNVPESAEARECSGSIQLVQREFMAAQAILVAGGSLDDYRRARPNGLTVTGLRLVVSRAIFGSVDVRAPTRTATPMPRPHLRDAEVGHPDFTNPVAL